MALDPQKKAAFIKSLTEREKQFLSALELYNSLDDFWNRSILNTAQQYQYFGKALETTDLEELSQIKNAWIQEVSRKPEWQAKIQALAKEKSSWVTEAANLPSIDPFAEIKQEVSPEVSREVPADLAGGNAEEELAALGGTPSSSSGVETKVPLTPPVPKPKTTVSLDDLLKEFDPVSSPASTSSTASSSTPSDLAGRSFEETKGSPTSGFGASYKAKTPEEAMDEVNQKRIASIASLLDKWFGYTDGRNSSKKGPSEALDDTFRVFQETPSRENFNAFNTALQNIEFPSKDELALTRAIDPEIPQIREVLDDLGERLYDIMSEDRLYGYIDKENRTFPGYIDEAQKFVAEYEQILPEIEDESQRKLIEKNISDLQEQLENPLDENNKPKAFIARLKALDRANWNSNGVLILVHNALKESADFLIAKKDKKGIFTRVSDALKESTVFSKGKKDNKSPADSAVTSRETIEINREADALLDQKREQIKEKFLMRELEANEAVGKVPETRKTFPKIFTRQVNPEVIAEGTKKFIDRFAGEQPDDMILPEDRLASSMAKELNQIKDFYVKELTDIQKTLEKTKNKTAEQSQDVAELPALIHELKSLNISIDTVKKEFKDKLHDAKAYRDAQVSMITNYISSAAADSNLSFSLESKISNLQDKLNNKLAIENAPKGNQALLKQLIEYQKTINKETEKQHALQSSASEMPTAEEDEASKKQAIEKIDSKLNALEKEEDAITELFQLLTNPETGTLERSIAVMRHLQIERKFDKEQYPKESPVDKILDDMLKKSDPYYAEIKDLEQYIINITKEYNKLPFSDKDRAIKAKKGAIALYSYNYLLPAELRGALPAKLKAMNLEPPSEKAIRKGAAQFSVTELQSKIRENRSLQKEHSFLGEIRHGRLDSILQDVLKKKQKGIEPVIQSAQFEVDKPSRNKP